MKRLTLFADGSCHGKFGSLDLHLSPSGSLAIFQEKETLIRLTIALKPSNQLRQLLDFRNAHINPYICSNLLTDCQHSQILETTKPIMFARWPFDHQNNQIESIDKHAKVTVNNIKNTFTVQFPVLVHDLAALQNDNRLKYIWIEQEHSLNSIPSAWNVPVSIIRGNFKRCTNSSYETTKLFHPDRGFLRELILHRYLAADS